TNMSRSRINQIYVWLVITTGVAVLAYSAAHLTRDQINIRFLLLALVTVIIGSRLSIPIPRVRAHISVSDTFLFLAILLFGGEAAVLLATAEAICSSMRISTRRQTHLFNASVMACATFMTVWALRFGFSEQLAGHSFYSQNYLAMLCTMAIIQYLGNSILVATGSALKSDEPIWQAWRTNFLWTSLTYLAGASAAGIIARFIGNVGFF